MSLCLGVFLLLISAMGAKAGPAGPPGTAIPPHPGTSLSITRFKNPQIEPKSPYDMTLPQDRIHIKTNHPMTIKRLLRAAILLHGEGILDQINPETKGASALDSQGEGLLGVTLTPYVGEGVPPASLRLDGTQTWGPPGGAPRSGPNQDTSFQNPVVKGQFRLQWGLRDLNLGVLDGPVASSLGRPDGFLVVEVNGWSRAGIIKHQLALGYRLLSKTGIDLDLLFPKHIIVGFQYRAHAPKIYLGTQVDLHFRRPLPVSEELTSVQTADLPDPFSTSRQQARPLELYETNSFFLGMQQRIGIPWHLFMEAGIRRTEWQLFGPVGQTVDRKTQKFLPFALLGIKSLIPSLQQPTH